MKSLLLTATALAALLGFGLPAHADSKFSGVAPHSEHRSYGHYSDRERSNHYRHGIRDSHYDRYRSSHRYDRRYERNTRHWRHAHERHYRCDRHRHEARYSRYRHSRYGYRYGVRLGEGIYLSPHGLTVRVDFDGRD